MKIYVLGSSHFRKAMVESKDKLRELGYDASIHPDYEAQVKGEMPEQLKRWEKGERAAIKRENDYFNSHYKGILKNDAVLFVNLEKNGIKNYIGGNVLIEMGQAYVNNKKIFFLNDLPTDLPYLDEVEAMDPICLKGDLKTISEYE